MTAAEIPSTIPLEEWLDELATYLAAFLKDEEVDCIEFRVQDEISDNYSQEEIETSLAWLPDILSDMGVSGDLALEGHSIVRR